MATVSIITVLAVGIASGCGQSVAWYDGRVAVTLHLCVHVGVSFVRTPWVVWWVGWVVAYGILEFYSVCAS